MNTATLRPRPAKDPTVFYGDLADTLTARREALTRARHATTGERPLTWAELTEWLRFQCWYRKEETDFIESWLAQLDGPALSIALQRRIAESSRHYRRLIAHLDTLGSSMDDWSPEPEWSNWVSEFYASGPDTLERVIAHHLAGDPNALTLPGGVIPKAHQGTQPMLEQLNGDGQLHDTVGRVAVAGHATTLERQAQIHARVMRTFELEQKSRLALLRRIRALREGAAANDALADSLTANGDHR